MNAAQRLLATALVLGVVLVAFEATALITALPTLTDELGGDSLYGVSLAAYTLANMVSLVVAGREADRRGPAPVFAASILVFVVGLIVAGAAPSMPVVVAGRVLQGIGSGGFSPIAFALVKRAFPPERQRVMYVYLSAGWVLPAVLGPLFGGLVTEAFGWRWVFFGIVPLALGVGAMALAPMRRFGPLDSEATPPVVVPALIAAGGVGAIVFTLPAGHWSIVVFGTLAGGFVAVAALRRLLPAGVFRAAPGYAAVLTTRLLAAATFIGVDGFIPLAADRVHGATPLVQGFVISGAVVSWTGGQWLTSRRPDLAVGRATAAGFVLLSVATVAAAPVVWVSWPLWLTFIAWSIGGFGMGVLFNPNTVAAMSYATPGREATVSSQIRLVESIGFSVGYGVGGGFIAASDRGEMGLVVALLACFVVALVTATLGLVTSRNAAAAL